MFADLPEPLQEKVRECLLENNFPAAKALYDEYHRQHTQQQHLSTHQNTTKHPQQVAR
jgi:hypothetical protein